MRGMRILIATPFKDVNRGEALGMYAGGLEEAFRLAGHSVNVVSRSRLEEVLPLGIRHVLYIARALPRVARSDVVLALDAWSTGFPALIAARISRKPFAIRIGGDFLWESHVERTKEPILLSEFYSTRRQLSFKERLIHRGLRYLTRHADVLLFTTRFQRDIWQRAYGFVLSRSHIVENYYPKPERSGALKGKVFVSAGRKMFLKNTNALERSFARVAKYTDISLDARALPHEAHLKRLREAYAVVIPTFSEVCSNTAIEAVSYGKPFIMSRDTGTSERLGACGLFIDTRDEQALVDALEDILTPETYKRLSQSIAAFSHTHSWDDIAKEMSGIFSKI